MRENGRAYWLLAPAGLLYAALFVIPFVYFFAISFFVVRYYQLQPAFTFANYAKTLTTNAGTIAFTVGMALAVTAATVSLGFVYAFIVRFKAGRWADLLLLIAVLTLFGGYLMKIYAWKTILGNQGVLNTGLLGAGLVEAPITALFYTPFAVVVTLVHFLLPFAILPIYSSLRGITDVEIEAARDLGASPFATLRDVVVPRAASGILGAFALCFLVASGDYVTPTLVGGTMTMMGNLIAPQFGSFFNWPLGAAMSFTTLGVAVTIVAAAAWLLGRVGRRGAAP